MVPMMRNPLTVAVEPSGFDSAHSLFGWTTTTNNATLLYSDRHVLSVHDSRLLVVCWGLCTGGSTAVMTCLSRLNLELVTRAVRFG